MKKKIIDTDNQTSKINQQKKNGNKMEGINTVGKGKKLWCKREGNRGGKGFKETSERWKLTRDGKTTKKEKRKGR